MGHICTLENTYTNIINVDIINGLKAMGFESFIIGHNQNATLAYIIVMDGKLKRSSRNHITGLEKNR